jgi:flagellar protein FlbD
MIKLRRFNGQEFILNADLIETLEATPDTVISLTNGRKYVVQNPVEEIIRNAIEYKKLCNQAIQVIHKPKSEDLEEDQGETNSDPD